MLLDGTDLRSIPSSELRENVVMVTQENYLFSGTVADNIRFGRPDATMEEVVAATTALGAHEFISAMPDGYDTDVANPAAGSPPASASWSPSPAPSSPTPRC